MRSWNRVLDAALSGLLVGLLAAGPALAQQPALRLLPRVLPAAAAPKLIVLVVPLDTPAQAQVPRLSYQAEQLLAGNARFDFLNLADALDAEGARAREAKAQEGAAALKEGLKAYDELDAQKALQQFDKAALAYEASDLSRHFTDMSRARVMKIASFVANGDNKGFVRELKEMLPRNPRAEFSSNYFPPDELATIEKTRKAILSEATRSLEVKTGEVHGQVFVDGQFQGISPVTLSGLTPAEHFVTVIAPGYALAQAKARGEANLTLQPVPSGQRLKAVVERISKEPDGLDRDAALRELGTLAGAQQVLALMVRGSPGVAPYNATAVRVDVADGHNLAYAQAAVPLVGDATEAALQSLLAGALQADAPRVKGKPGHVPAIETGSGRKTAGYVLMGTGVALVAGGVFFGLQASSKSDEFKKTPQTNTAAAEKLRSDGKTFALVADVGLIAGLLSAGTGAWLAFSGGGEGAKAEPPPRRPVTPPSPKPAPSHETKPAPSREPPPAARPAEKPAPAPAPAPAAPAPAPAPAAPAPAPAPQGKPAANAREEEKRKREEERRKREEEERLKREEEDKKKRDGDRLKREEEDKKREEERLKREEAAKREQEEKKKREEEEKKKREEEDKKKKKPSVDEDDLRNY